MKKLSNMAFRFLEQNKENILVDFIASIGEWISLKPSKLSMDLKCVVCGDTGHYAPFVEPEQDTKRVWICANPHCSSTELKNIPSGTTTVPPISIRVPWPLFCERNGIGDVYWNVTFQSIEQSKEKIAFMLNFVRNPKGFLIMQGKSGTGKTYAAMGMCQLFLMNDHNCMFLTQRRMTELWLESKIPGNVSNFRERIKNSTLLVIDDFASGTIEIGFMTYFLDLINERMQWSNRGTVITTNLNDEQLIVVCGEAIVDRLITGQHFSFTEKKTRRSKSL